MDCADHSNPYALVVPGSGQGHVNPCILLARSLATIGFQVSFVYFSSEYAKLEAKQHLVEPGLGSSAVDGRGAIRTHVVEDELGPGDADTLFFYSSAMKENLYNLILELREQGTPPTCLIADTWAPWTAPVAERAGIPLINFWTSNAMSYLLVYGISFLFSQGIFPEKGPPTQWKRETPLMLDHIPGIPPFPSERYPTDVRFANASDFFVRLLHEVADCGQVGERMLLHTMSELEPVAFSALQGVGVFPAYAIGSLLEHAQMSGTPSQALGLQPNEKTDYAAWLDSQAESSVIYVAFGSHASICAEDIQELALGLEASGNPFLWVIREDLCGSAELPQLGDGISGKGMVISWAPQVEVLAHKAVGGFLTHCGWNSTLESFWEGVPMLCCPVFAEQLSNSHYICSVWGVGLELGRTSEGSIKRQNVEVGVKALMQGEEGLQARGKAQEIMQLTRKACRHGSEAFNNLQKFYEDMKQLCCSSSNCSK